MEGVSPGDGGIADLERDGPGGGDGEERRIVPPDERGLFPFGRGRVVVPDVPVFDGDAGDAGADGGSPGGLDGGAGMGDGWGVGAVESRGQGVRGLLFRDAAPLAADGRGRRRASAGWSCGGGDSSRRPAGRHAAASVPLLRQRGLRPLLAQRLRLRVNG